MRPREWRREMKLNDMRRIGRIGRIGRIAGISSMAGPGFAADTHPPHASALSDVAGLAKAVTYTETKIPLGELIGKVAVETGVQLVAARAVVDEPVAVVVQEVPARELLERLAGLLDYQWS